MTTVNKVILIGYLGRDPEVRSTQSGAKIVNMSVATTETWRDKETGNKIDKTEWHRVAVFNEAAANFADRYLKKGRLIYLEGQLQTRKWTDQSGAERFVTEVVVPRFNGVLIGLADGTTREDGQQTEAAKQRAYTRKPKDYYGDLDDEIPFP